MRQESDESPRRWRKATADPSLRRRRAWVAGSPSLDAIITDLTKKFTHKFPKKVVDANIRAVKRAYEEVKSE